MLSLSFLPRLSLLFVTAGSLGLGLGSCSGGSPPLGSTVSPPSHSEVITPLPESVVNDDGATYRQACADPLAIVAGFSLVVFGDLNVYNSAADGRVAVGGNANVSQYSVGRQLPPSFGTRDDLLINGSLTFSDGTLFSGNLVYGESARIKNVSLLSGTTRHFKALDLAPALTQLQWASRYLGSFPANGETRFTYGQLTLKGSRSTLNIFKVNGSDLARANSLTIEAPPHAAILINVNGTAPSVTNMGFSLQNATRDFVLYNFFQAQRLEVNSVGVEGSILAPHAEVAFDNGVIHGTLIGQGLEGYGHFQDPPFQGCLPKVPPNS